MKLFIEIANLLRWVFEFDASSRYFDTLDHSFDHKHEVSNGDN